MNRENASWVGFWTAVIITTPTTLWWYFPNQFDRLLGFLGWSASAIVWLGANILMPVAIVLGIFLVVWITSTYFLHTGTERFWKQWKRW